MNRRIAIWTALAVVALAVIAVTQAAYNAGSASAAVGSSASFNVVVLCSSCGIPENEETAHILLLDQNTGEVWAYREADLRPVAVGRLTRLGAPLQK